jgi:hypothetical protein
MFTTGTVIREGKMNYLKVVIGALAAIALLLGSIWVLQGVNVLPGSFMTGDIRWAYRGAAVAVVGAALLYWALRTPGVWRGVLGIFGTLLILGGVIFFLQGLNILLGSPMSGDIRWAYRGAVQAVVGFALLFLSLRNRRRQRG